LKEEKTTLERMI
jgi:hypothetical protein